MSKFNCNLSLFDTFNKFDLMLCQFHKDGIIIRVNDFLADFIGRSHEELVGKNFLDFIPEVDRESVKETIKNLNSKNPVATNEHRAVINGEIRWLRWTNVPIYDDNDREIIYYFSRCEDITEQKKSYEDYKMLFETMVEGFALHDIICDEKGNPVDYRFLSVNPAFERLTGLLSENIIGKTVLEIMPETEKNWIQKYGNIALSGKSINFENYSQVLRKFYDVTAFSPKKGQFACIFSDVTKLKKSEKKHRSIVETAVNAIIILNTNFEIIEWNAAAENIFEYTKEEILGLRYADLFVNKERKEIVVKDFNDVLSGKILKNFENTITTKSAKEKILLWNLTRIPGLADNTEGIVAIGQDITNIKFQEEQNRKIENQMLHAQKLESLGILAGGIAHDFNNILMGILGNTDLALYDISPTSPTKKYLEEIETSSIRASELCRQMLAYAGKGKFEIININLNDIIEEMINILEVTISKKVVIKYEFMPVTPAINADPTQIRQVIMNLVVNASDAIGDKSGIISIKTGVLDCDDPYLQESMINNNQEKGLYVFVEITDTGSGMNKKTIEKIFDPFYTTKFTGRGLGLAAVQGIVNGHDGAIRVYSEVDKGTSFKLLFPLTEDPVDNPDKIDELKNINKFKGKILVADDEISVRAVIKQMLMKLGFDVILANDGREALKIFKENKDLNCAILDLTMPHLSGEECFKEMRKIRNDFPIIISSGYNEQEVTLKFVGRNISGFIQKPFRTKELLQKLNTIFENQ